MPRILQISLPIADVGTYLYVAHNQSLPYGTLIADGSILSVASYPKLAAKLGNTYGGDGITTFGLPDCRGRALIGDGLGSGLSINRVLGTLIGEELSSLAAIPLHQHTVSFTGIGNHQHSYSSSYNGPDQTGADVVPREGVINTSTDTGTSSHSHSYVLPSQGSGVPHKNIQPSLPGVIVIVVQ